ncbi:MAG TPA: hypothetical protein VN654_31190 [Vicinamibacterales bacterium]|jgi:TolA-binding protein|nr:hypothetical protein [Vicinamibacterales bacterium]
MIVQQYGRFVCAIPRALVFAAVPLILILAVVIVQAQGRGAAAGRDRPPCVADPQSPACFQQRFTELGQRLDQFEQRINKVAGIQQVAEPAGKAESASPADVRGLQQQIDQLRNRLNQLIQQLKP